MSDHASIIVMVRQAAEKQAIKDENAAQADYEKLAKETTANVASKTKEAAV